MLSIRSQNYRWLAVALSLAAFCALAAPALAKKMKGPKATASPNANLTNNQMVTVTGSGFVAGSEVFLVECNKGIKGQSGTGGISFCEPNPPHLVGPIKITTEGTLPPRASPCSPEPSATAPVAPARKTRFATSASATPKAPITTARW